MDDKLQHIMLLKEETHDVIMDIISHANEQVRPVHGPREVVPTIEARNATNILSRAYEGSWWALGWKVQAMKWRNGRMVGELRQPVEHLAQVEETGR